MFQRKTSPKVHRHSNLLTKEENESVFSLFAPKCVSLATTLVQIFTTTAPEHSDWTKLDAGVLCLMKDNHKRSYYFRVYCPERRSLIWEHEVYNNMQYNLSQLYFHMFEAQNSIIAFNFASVEEAQYLGKILLEKLERKKQVQGLARQNSIKNGKKKKEKKTFKNLKKEDIGMPTNPLHTSHNGVEVNKGIGSNIWREKSPEFKPIHPQNDKVGKAGQATQAPPPPPLPPRGEIPVPPPLEALPQTAPVLGASAAPPNSTFHSNMASAGGQNPSSQKLEVGCKIAGGSSDSSANMFDEIRRGVRLRPVPEKNYPKCKSNSSDSKGDLLDQLRNNMKSRMEQQKENEASANDSRKEPKSLRDILKGRGNAWGDSDDDSPLDDFDDDDDDLQASEIYNQ